MNIKDVCIGESGTLACLLFGHFQNILNDLLFHKVVFIVCGKEAYWLQTSDRNSNLFQDDLIRDKAYQALQTLILVITQMNRGKIYKLGLSLLRYSIFNNSLFSFIVICYKFHLSYSYYMATQHLIPPVCPYTTTLLSAR